jgi:sialidase-1
MASIRIVRIIIFSCVLLLVAFQHHKKPFLFRTDVFVNGEEGYSTYRIPAMVVSNSGTVLAFCEGRKNDSEDMGDIDLLLKRSNDGGKTWQRQQVVYEEGGDAHITIGNPCPIVQEGSDRIHLLFTREYREIYYTYSDDDGLNWSTPQDISQVIGQFDYPVVVVATGPGHGIHTGNGRLVVPIWVCNSTREERYKGDVPADRMRCGIIFSDDSGESWRAGGLVSADVPLMNEATVVERSTGELLINMRARNAGHRAEACSYDGGLTWTSPTLDSTLIDPTCQGSIYRTDEGKFLFSNPATDQVGHSKYRRNVTLRVSHDEGRTWSRSLTLDAGPSGYSDIAQRRDGHILCLFENGKDVYREKISIVAVNKRWMKKP